MNSYIEIDENSNGAILKRARLNYAEKSGKFTQLDLAEYLGVSPGYIGQWEQGQKPIPEKYFTKINNLLGTHFETQKNFSNNYINKYQATLYFYFGLYKFSQRQCEYIMAKLLIKFCEKILDKEEIKKYKKIINTVKKNAIFTEVSYSNYKKCYSYILKYLESLYPNKKNESNTTLYFSEISNKFLLKKDVRNEINNLLHSLDYKQIIYEPYQNVPVYNRSGVIIYYESLPPKYIDNKYEYVYYQIDNIENRLESKYVDGALALIRLGNFCFPKEDVIINCDKKFDIKHIKSKDDLINAFRNSFGTDKIIENGYEIIGSVVMIDYSTCSINDEKEMIKF